MNKDEAAILCRGSSSSSSNNNNSDDDDDDGNVDYVDSGKQRQY